ncbi:MAG: hypothetical protein AAGD14_11040 [Planctomycetota bacterium]
MAEYKVGRRAPECAATQQPFAEGEEIVSAIFEGDEGFERRDYKVEAFGEVKGYHSFWKGRIPVKQEDPQRLDYDLALEFFRRLVHENEAEHEGLRFVLGLLLGRKRRLKLKGFARKKGQETLELVLRGDEEDEPLSLAVPPLDEEGRDTLQRDLNRLFGIEEPAEEPSGESAEEPAEEPAEAQPAGEPAEGQPAPPAS